MIDECRQYPSKTGLFNWSIPARIQNITAITLASPNMSRAIRFYCMLGFEIGYLNLIAHLPSEIGLGGDVLSSTIPTLTPSMRVVAAG